MIKWFLIRVGARFFRLNADNACVLFHPPHYKPILSLRSWVALLQRRKECAWYVQLYKSKLHGSKIWVPSGDAYLDATANR